MGSAAVGCPLQFLYAGKRATLSIGNIKPVGDMPEGTIVCNVEEVRPSPVTFPCFLPSSNCWRCIHLQRGRPRPWRQRSEIWGAVWWCV